MNNISFNLSTKISVSYLFRCLMLSFVLLLFFIILGVILMAIGNNYYQDNDQWKNFLTYFKDNGLSLFSKVGPKPILLSFSSYISSLLIELISFGALGVLVFKRVWRISYNDFVLCEKIKNISNYSFWLKWYIYSWIISLPIRIITDYIMAKNDQNIGILLSNAILLIISTIIIDAKILQLLVQKNINQPINA